MAIIGMLDNGEIKTLLTQEEPKVSSAFLVGDINNKFHDFAVIYNHKQAVNLTMDLMRYDKDILKKMFKDIYANIVKFSNEQMILEQEKQSQRFSEWCTDCLLFLCVRFVLTGKPIKLISLDYMPEYNLD
jgi:hypothetical protein